MRFNTYKYINMKVDIEYNIPNKYLGFNMKMLNPQKVFTQYRNSTKPYEPIEERKYTITHSDTSAELYVFIAGEYAEDQITDMRDEVRVAWENNGRILILHGHVLVDGKGISGAAAIRDKIFYNEMPIALQALRQADRFLFEEHPELDSTPVFVRFVSENPIYNKVYNFGIIGNYRITS